jgi:hypothetical protein
MNNVETKRRAEYNSQKSPYFFHFFFSPFPFSMHQIKKEARKNNFSASFLISARKEDPSV